MFTSGDGNGDIQHVGYPDFLTIQNSVPMPVTKGEHKGEISRHLMLCISVAAECRGSACSSQPLSFSIQDGSESFYIDEVTGDVFLVSVGGSSSVASACPDTWCDLKVRARMADPDVSEDISLKISSIPETDILILDTHGPVSAVDTVIDEINKAQNVSGKFWFRKLNVQPREGDRNKADTDTLAFVTALDIENERFLDSGAAKDIIEYVNLCLNINFQ